MFVRDKKLKKKTPFISYKILHHVVPVPVLSLKLHKPKGASLQYQNSSIEVTQHISLFPNLSFTETLFFVDSIYKFSKIHSCAARKFNVVYSKQSSWTVWSVWTCSVTFMKSIPLQGKKISICFTAAMVYLSGHWTNVQKRQLFTSLQANILQLKRWRF